MIRTKRSKRQKSLGTIMKQDTEHEFEEIAALIPENWIELHHQHYQKLLSQALLDLTDTILSDHQETFGEDLNQDVVRVKAILMQQQQWNESQVDEWLVQSTTIQAKIELFHHHFGHLLPKDEQGHPVLPLPILAKITGLPLEDLQAQAGAN